LAQLGALPFSMKKLKGLLSIGISKLQMFCLTQYVSF